MSYYYDSEPIGEESLMAMYDDMIDETTGEVVIGSLTYAASRVLREVDPIAYRVGFSEWLDGAIVDGVVTEDETVR